MDATEVRQRPIWAPALALMVSFGWFGYCGWYIQNAVGFKNLTYSLPHELALMVIALVAPPCFLWLPVLYHQRARVSSEELERVLARFEALDAKPEEHQEYIEGVTANLREAGEEITKRGEQITGALAKPLEDFRTLNEKLSGLVRDGETAILKQRNASETAVEDAQGQLRTIINELGLTIDRLKESSSEAAQRSKQAGEEVTGFTEELTKTLKSFAEQSAKLREDLKGDAAAIREGEKTLLSGAEELHRLTKAATGALNETGAETLGRTEAFEEQLSAAQQQVETWKAAIGETSDATRGEAAKLSEELAGEAEKIGDALRGPVSVLTSALEELRQRTLRLEEAAAKAGERAEVLQRADLEARTEYFMRQAASVLSDLNGTAFELSKFLEEEVPRDLLKQYKAGDRSVFARRLARSPQYYVPEIRRRFEEDAGFRQASSHFITRFEDLLSRASACDPDNTLASAFLTADAGKLYMLLARSIGSRA